MRTRISCPDKTITRVIDIRMENSHYRLNFDLSQENNIK